MTKRDIIRFLEQKMMEKRRAVEADYTAACERERQRVYDDELALPALAAKMQPLLRQAYELWDGWKAEHKDYEGLSIDDYYYSTLISHLSRSSESEDATYNKLITEHIRFESKALASMGKESLAEQERVMATFTTVISTVRQMKHAKEAAAYLKELGFDLSELENPGEQAQTALMVPVDTRYLFVKAA